MQAQPQVMVVDDDPGDVPTSFEAFLAERGYQAVMMGNAEDALQALHDGTSRPR